MTSPHEPPMCQSHPSEAAGHFGQNADLMMFVGLIAGDLKPSGGGSSGDPVDSCKSVKHLRCWTCCCATTPDVCWVRRLNGRIHGSVCSSRTTNWMNHVCGVFVEWRCVSAAPVSDVILILLDDLCSSSATSHFLWRLQLLQGTADGRTDGRNPLLFISNVIRLPKSQSGPNNCKITLQCP